MRGDLKLIWGLRQAFSMEISRAGKLARKGGKSSKTGGEHVVLPTQTLQGPISTQKVRSVAPTGLGKG